jgi:hypothetical protein
MQINRSDEVLYLDHVSLSGDLKKSSFIYPSVICASDGFVSPVLESGFNSGGTFSSSAGLVFDPNSGIIDAGNSIPGYYTINYSYGSSVCSTYSFTIYPTPTTTPIYHEETSTTQPYRLADDDWDSHHHDGFQPKRSNGPK